jgi:subfamily B ATP-binding cassette protein MsbA
MIEFWLKLWQLSRPYKGRFVLGLVFGVLSGVADTVVMVTLVFVFGVVFVGAKDASVNAMVSKWSPWLALEFEKAQHGLAAHVHVGSNGALILVVGLVPLVMLGRGVCNYLTSYMMGWVAVRALCDLRARLFEHLLRLPASFLARNSTGELMSRVGDVGVLQNMIGVSMVTIIKEPISILTKVAGLCIIDFKLTLIALVGFPFCVIPVVVYNRKVRRAGAAIQTEQANLSRMMHEAFTGNRIVKGYNLEQMVVERFRANQKKFISQYMRVIRSTESPGPIIEFLGSIGVGILLVYLAQSTTTVVSFLFIGAVVAIYAPVKAVIRLQSELQRTRAATARAFELLATKSTLVDPPRPVPLKAAHAPIEFDNVSFSYGDRPALRHIQLRIEPGQMVALVGRSGSGKTTLANLLLRFYDPSEGAVRIGGVDLRQAAVRDVRAQMAVVTQEVILFDDTIANNIAVGRPGASRGEIEEAARHAFAHEFIVEKPQGYESVVGEKGTNLSGGERQRIAIARAILRNAPILILDEAMSSLDNAAERIVQKALDELMKGRATLCVAHRLSTVQHADLIIVMENGQIVERGRHADLLERHGYYFQLHALSFRGRSENQ